MREIERLEVDGIVSVRNLDRSYAAGLPMITLKHETHDPLSSWRWFPQKLDEKCIDRWVKTGSFE